MIFRALVASSLPVFESFFAPDAIEERTDIGVEDTAGRACVRSVFAAVDVGGPERELAVSIDE